MKNLKTRLSILGDYLKDFFIFIVLITLIIVVLSSISHNIIKIIQLFETYSGEYKKVVEIQNGDIVNIYTIGEGEKTVVILPGYGVQSPVLMYKNIAERLKSDYKVVIVEYPGYGFAKNTDSERTNQNIANDIKDALEKVEISGPYVLIPHSISNMYAMKFCEMYPELVEAVISVDGSYPEWIESEEGKKYINNMVKNVKITSVLEHTGFARILSYVRPNIYYIDFMKNDEFINDADIKLYRKMIATNYLTKTMVSEIENAEKNMQELKNYKYPENLPVLEILSTESIKEYDERTSKGKLKKLARNVISNEELQNIVEIDGSRMLNLSNPDELVQEIKEFI